MNCRLGATASRPCNRQRRYLLSTVAGGDQPVNHLPPTTCAVPWNHLLRAHVCRSRPDLALALYRRMRTLCPALPNSYTLPLALRAASSPRIASAIHAHALHLGLHAHPNVAGQLLAAYARLGRAKEARIVFDVMPTRTTMSWNTLISAYSVCCDPDSAMAAFTRMAAAEAHPDAVTWTTLLSAHARCGRHPVVLELFREMHGSGCEGNAESVAVALSACPYAGDLALVKGRVIHGYGVVKGVVRGYLFVTNSLLCMYGKVGEMDDARKVFRDAGEKNTVTWNALITSYAAAGMCDEAFEVLVQMEQRGGSMVAPNVVSWSAVIGGFASSGDNGRALELFRRMQRQRLSPNVVTLATVFSACAELLALRLGREVHAHAIRSMLDRHSLVENGLISMYAKCGRVAAARKVFDCMKSRDLVSWNSMLAGYGMHGLCDEALEVFADMAKAKVGLDGVTFVAVLSACSHAGRVSEGRRLFDQMQLEHKISPSMEHYTCMVDLLGRAGLLKDASELIETMPMGADLCVWGALLNSCRIHGDATMAEATIAKVLQAGAETTGNHTLITNLYAACGMWDESKRVRVMTREAGLRKNPGQSWIEVKNKVFSFIAGSVPPSLPGAEEIFGVLDDLYGEMEDERHAIEDGILNV